MQATICVSRMLKLPSLHGNGRRKLDEFDLAQGYPASAYVGGGTKVLGAFEEHTHGDGDAMLPPMTQKALRPEVWDATGHVRGLGAHMACLPSRARLRNRGCDWLRPAYSVISRAREA